MSRAGILGMGMKGWDGMELGSGEGCVLARLLWNWVGVV